MESLRRRIPFNFEEDYDDGVLDEQQQEAVIAALQKRADLLRKWFCRTILLLVGASLVLQLLLFLSNPLLAIFPVSAPDPSLPVPYAFALLSLFIHSNFALHFVQEEGNLLQMDNPPTPLSFPILYSLSGVAPALSLLLNKPWQTTIGLYITPVIVFLVQMVVTTLDSTDDAMAKLEMLKYHASGA